MVLVLLIEDDDEVSNRILDRLSDVWAERGASCCCWEGVGAAVVMVDMSCCLLLFFSQSKSTGDLSYSYTI